MDMELIQRQSQTVSPQLAQTMKLLQMNALELKAYLEEVSMENPVVELEAPEPEEDDSVLEALSWLRQKDLDGGLREETAADEEQDDPMANLPARYREEESLSFFVRCQLAALRLPPQVDRAARWIADNLDENGWYARGQKPPFPPEIEVEALRAVQGLEPAGVGAPDLRDCLLLQLERQPGDHALAKAIVADHLEDLARNHFHHIAKALGVSQEKVRRAREEIVALDPRPGRAFDTPRATEYIRPDILVIRDGERLSLRLLEQDIPRLQLNEYYCTMLKQTDQADVSAYLQEKVRQARWLRQSIRQRHDTILRCMEVILDIQRRFFLTGGELAPMALQDVAARAGVHESTVSRAVRGKYLQCAHGLYPLSRFFVRTLAEGAQTQVTVDAVKDRLASLIAGEDRRKPLSDQQLCRLLGQCGMEISRRTVAKYRAELGLPPATGRREL